MCFAAAGARAAPAPTLFGLSVAGTAHQEWDHTSAPTMSAECKRSLRSEGFRSVRFRSKKQTVVRVVDGRVLPAEVRSLGGTVTVTGANTIDEICGELETHMIQDCVKSRRSVAAARVSLLGTRRGSITLRPVRNVRLRAINCPREPGDVVRAPLGPIPGPLRISTSALSRSRIARITLTASGSRTKTYAPPETGTFEQRAAWTLTFVRLQP